MFVKLKMSLAAIGALRKELGFKQTLSVISTFLKMKRRGEPFKGFEPPGNSKDRGSRDQLGDAILVYRALLDRLPREEAERITREVILAGAMAFLRGTVPVLRREEILSKTKEEQEALLTSIIEKFPNPDWEIVETTETSFFYRITRCRFPEMLEKLGHPELSNAFCAADELYFNEYQSDIDLERTTMIGAGDKCCDFLFSLKEE
ncbi:MAG: L-2-amino-thiazoline-4-carboxylic acid hydrolase [Candidatus Hodarchaeota archaeon]